MRERVLALSRLFKHEFTFRADARFETIFDEEVAAMESDGELVRAAVEAASTELRGDRAAPAVAPTRQAAPVKPVSAVWARCSRARWP